MTMTMTMTKCTFWTVSPLAQTPQQSIAFGSINLKMVCVHTTLQVPPNQLNQIPTLVLVASQPFKWFFRQVLLFIWQMTASLSWPTPTVNAICKVSHDDCSQTSRQFHSLVQHACTLHSCMVLPRFHIAGQKRLVFPHQLVISWTSTEKHRAPTF